MVYQVNALSSTFHQSQQDWCPRIHNVEREFTPSGPLSCLCTVCILTLNEMKSCKEFFIWKAKTLPTVCTVSICTHFLCTDVISPGFIFCPGLQRFCCREWAWQSNSSTCDWQEHFTLRALWLLSVQKTVWWFVVVMIVSWSQQVSPGCLLASLWCGSRLPTFLRQLTLPHWLPPNVHNLWTQ